MRSHDSNSCKRTELSFCRRPAGGGAGRGVHARGDLLARHELGAEHGAHGAEGRAAAGLQAPRPVEHTPSFDDDAARHRGAMLALWRPHCDAGIGPQRPIPYHRNLQFSVARAEDGHQTPFLPFHPPPRVSLVFDAVCVERPPHTGVQLARCVRTARAARVQTALHSDVGSRPLASAVFERVFRLRKSSPRENTPGGGESTAGARARGRPTRGV